MRKVLLAGVLFIAASAMAAIPKSMVVHTDSGVKSYSIENIRKLTFGTIQDNLMEVHLRSSVTEIVFPYSQIQKVSFSDNSGVAEVKVEEPNVRVQYKSSIQSLCVTADEPLKSIQVLDMKGSVAVTVAPGDNEATVPLSSLLSGIYVVRVVTESFVTAQKIVKR